MASKKISELPLITTPDGTELIPVVKNGVNSVITPTAAKLVGQAATDMALAKIGRMPSILVAASNSPAYVKARADYVCTGVDDNVVFQTIINAFPTLPNLERSKVLVTGGKYGFITMAPGKFNFSATLVIPAGSVIRLEGAGVSSWRPIDTKGSQYEGGTMIYSTAPDGQVITTPRFTGVRTDDGTADTIPSHGILFRDFEIVAFNPATSQNSSYALNLDGMTTGIVQNINVFADLSVNTIPRIGGGVAISGGARTDRKTVTGVHSFFFRNAGFLIGTTHLDASQLVAGNITGGTSPASFQITPNQNVRLFNLHAFSASIGIKMTSAAEQVNIDSVMFESITTPVSLTFTGSENTLTLEKVFMNSDVPWTGDIVDKVRVNWIGGTKAGFGAAAKRIRNGGVATITAGQTTLAVPHQLIATPLNFSARGRNGSIPVTVTADATNITLTIASQGTDTLISWSATATINE